VIRFFAVHPTAANLLMVAFLALGLLALPGLKRETFPDFTPEEVEVLVPYPGASAEEVESAVCQRIEDAVDSIADVEELSCEARESVGVAVVTLREGGDFARFLDDVKTEVEAIDAFPEEVERPVIRQLGRTDRVVAVAVTGPMSESHLKLYAEGLKDRLQQLAVRPEVAVEGFSEHHLRVHVPGRALSQHGLSVEDVARAIERQSTTLPAGAVETRAREVRVRFDEERRSPAELERLVVIGGPSGGELRLGDIATVTDRFELDEEKALFDGERAALLRVTKAKDDDTLTVVDAVKRLLAGERARAPPAVRFALTQDVASIVEDRLELLVRNGWQGLTLVLLTMWLFFRLRLAFWVAWGLPVSFLGGLFFMAALGYSINMITMVSLLLGIGLIMDDAIVISENIAAHLRRGKRALEAAVDGTREVAPGVVASFLTTLAVFAPLAFLSGDIGKVMRVLPVVLLLVLAVSLVEAFLILPHHLARSLRERGTEPEGRFRRAFEARFERLRERGLGRAVDWAVGSRYLFVGLVVALFLVSLATLAGGHLKFRAFPEIDGDVIEARLLLPAGTPLARTEAVVARLTEALARVDAEFTPRQPEGERLVRHVAVRYGVNADAGVSGPHVATVTADLLTAERREARLAAVLGRWREETGRVPDVVSLTFKEPQIGPAGLPIDIRLSGPDLDELSAASRELVEWLARYRGVFDLFDDLRPDKPEVRLRLREGALALGLDAAAIARQVRAAFHGVTAAEIQVGREAYEIDVRLPPTDRDTLTELETFRILTPDGAQVPLAAVTTLEPARGYSRIQRIDGRRTVTIRGDLDSRVANASEILADTRVRFLPELEARHPTVEVSLEGQAREAGETGASLRRAFLIGLLGVFVLLSFQFRSYLEPLAVMSAVPLALIGVVWGHLLMGLELSMPSLIGFVSLSGIVVNDSILLVTFLKLRAREGLAVPEAAKRASRERFRAVLLTSLTTIAGLLPLMLERSLQAQVLIPLVVSIVFGLLATTVLVLLVVPALYAILDDLGVARPHAVGVLEA